MRKGIIPGNLKTLWKSIANAKDLNTEELPKMMYRNNVEIEEEKIAETFAEFFESRVNNLVHQAVICPQVYNGSPKIEVENENFMSMENVLRSMK